MQAIIDMMDKQQSNKGNYIQYPEIHHNRKECEKEYIYIYISVCVCVCIIESLCYIAEITTYCNTYTTIKLIKVFPNGSGLPRRHMW